MGDCDRTAQKDEGRVEGVYKGVTNKGERMSEERMCECKRMGHGESGRPQHPWFMSIMRDESVSLCKKYPMSLSFKT